MTIKEPPQIDGFHLVFLRFEFLRDVSRQL